MRIFTSDVHLRKAYEHEIEDENFGQIISWCVPASSLIMHFPFPVYLPVPLSHPCYHKHLLTALRLHLSLIPIRSTLDRDLLITHTPQLLISLSSPVFNVRDLDCYLPHCLSILITSNLNYRAIYIDTERNAPSTFSFLLHSYHTRNLENIVVAQRIFIVTL